MKHILIYVKSARERIISELYQDIEYIQTVDEPIDIEPLKQQIDEYGIKKRKAIDLMIDGLRTKDDLKKQTEYYDSEISALTEKISATRDMNAVHRDQIEKIKGFIEQVRKTSEADTDSHEVYREITKGIKAYKDKEIHIYLKFVPFGFRIIYHVNWFNKEHRFDVFINKCEIIE